MAGSAAELIADANAHAARPLPLSAVRLTGGPLKHAQDLDAEYLLKLEPDRMLAYFRERAGLKPKFVKGKKKVAVRFQAADGKEIAAVYGIRVIRADAQR